MRGEVEGLAGCRVSSDWTYRGLRALVLENEYLRVVSLVEKGSDIVELLYKPLGIDFMWHSPLGVRGTASPLHSDGRWGASFLDVYEGGWQDILPVAGLPSAHRGAEWDIHGETGIIPWGCRVEKDSGEEAVAYLSVDLFRYPLRVEKWLSLRRGEKVFSVKERVTNLSPQELEFTWLQHPAYSEPFIQPGCTIDIPAEKVVVHEPDITPYARLQAGYESMWPITRDRQGRDVDLSIIPPRELVAGDVCYLTDLRDGWYAVTNKRLNLGLGLVWEKEVYRCVWFWQNYNVPDYPWWSRCWNIALEPCTTWPSGLEIPVKQGTAPKIAGNSSVDVSLKVVVYSDVSRVESIEPSGAVKGR